MNSNFNSSIADGDLYSDDDAHPIPRVKSIDVETRLKSGGAYYGLVISSPLGADERSQKRLLQKIQNYIADFYSEKSLKLIGGVAPQNARIHVAIHPDSDPTIFRLLEQCRSWVEEKRITFIIDTNLGTSEPIKLM